VLCSWKIVLLPNSYHTLYYLSWKEKDITQSFPVISQIFVNLKYLQVNRIRVRKGTAPCAFSLLRTLYISCAQKGASTTFSYLSTCNFQLKTLVIRDVDCVHPPVMRSLMRFISSIALTVNVLEVENYYRHTYIKPGTFSWQTIFDPSVKFEKLTKLNIDVYCLHSLNQLSQFPALDKFKLSNIQYFAMWRLASRCKFNSSLNGLQRIREFETACVKPDVYHVILSTMTNLKKLRITVDFLCDETLHIICSLNTLTTIHIGNEVENGLVCVTDFGFTGIHCFEQSNQLLGRTHPFIGDLYLLEEFILYPHTMDMGPSTLTNATYIMDLLTTED
jgi:hypothetical protein